MLGFIDIETVPQVDPRTLSAPPENFFERFAHKTKEDQNMVQYYEDTAGLYAEHGKIICVSIGLITVNDGVDKLKIKTLAAVNERALLTAVSPLLEKFHTLCAHNGKEFDFPFLSRRMLINGISLPVVLNVAGKKPWETPLEDTMDMWSLTQWKYKCSLDLIAQCLGLPSPKQDMCGADVCKVYYSMFSDVEALPFDAEERVLAKIKTYCSGDVVTLANVYRKLKGLEVIKEENIIYS